MSVRFGDNYELPDYECYAVVIPRLVPVVARANRLPEHGFVLDEQTFRPTLPSSCGHFFNYLWKSDSSWIGFTWNRPDLSPTPDNNDHRLIAMLAERPYFRRDSFDFVEFVLDNQTHFEDAHQLHEELILEFMTFQGDRGDQAFAIHICCVEPERLGLLSRNVTLLEETTTS